MKKALTCPASRAKLEGFGLGLRVVAIAALQILSNALPKTVEQGYFL